MAAQNKYSTARIYDIITSSDLLYTFYQNNWYWCIMSSGCPITSGTPIPDNTYWKLAGNPGTSVSLSDNNLNFLTSLGTVHTYSGGLALLIQRTITNQEGGGLKPFGFTILSSDDKLSTSNVDYTPDGIFTIHTPNKYDFYLIHAQSTWQWNTYSGQPLDSWPYVTSTSSNGQNPTTADL